jgi:tripartite-type tricarboxylate transporter receptor subunit TctC
MRSLFPRLIRLLPIAALAAAQAALAQGAKSSFPDKPVKVVVGYSPGGLPDTIAAHRTEALRALRPKAVKMSGAKVE